MKTKEELNAIKEEVKTLNKKLAALTDEEFREVVGGKENATIKPTEDPIWRSWNPGVIFVGEEREDNGK